MTTTGDPAALKTETDRDAIEANGVDLAFITVDVTDDEGLSVPNADNNVIFTIEGPGEIVATDNGDPTNLTPFPSHERKAFGGKLLVIVRSEIGNTGTIKVTAKSPGLKDAVIEVQSK